MVTSRLSSWRWPQNPPLSSTSSPPSGRRATAAAAPVLTLVISRRPPTDNARAGTLPTFGRAGPRERLDRQPPSATLTGQAAQQQPPTPVPLQDYEHREQREDADHPGGDRDHGEVLRAPGDVGVPEPHLQA